MTTVNEKMDFFDFLMLTILFFVIITLPTICICVSIHENKKLNHLENEKTFCRKVYLEKDKILEDCKKYISEEMN